MKIIRGVTRTVLVLRHSVVKVPSVYSFRHFLMGLLANMQEADWWRETRDPRLCPVRWSFPGGFFNVMRRAEPFHGEADWAHFEGLPLDPKETNLGVVDGRIVLVDYGS